MALLQKALHRDRLQWGANEACGGLATRTQCEGHPTWLVRMGLPTAG